MLSDILGKNSGLIFDVLKSKWLFLFVNKIKRSKQFNMTRVVTSNRVRKCHNTTLTCCLPFSHIQYHRRPRQWLELESVDGYGFEKEPLLYFVQEP